MYSLFVIFFLGEGFLTGGVFCTVCGYPICVYRYYLFSIWVARTSGASAPCVLPVTPYNSFLYVVIIILYLCMFGRDKYIYLIFI